MRGYQLACTDQQPSSIFSIRSRKKGHLRFSPGLRDRHSLAGPGLRSLAQGHCVPSTGADCVLFPGGFRRPCTDRAAESSKPGHRLGDTERFCPGRWAFPRTAGIHGADGDVCQRYTPIIGQYFRFHLVIRFWKICVLVLSILRN